MTGISYMIPVVVAGGILGALATAFGGVDIGNFVKPGVTPWSNMNAFTWMGFWWGVHQVGAYAMNFAVAVLTAGITYAISGRPGIVPGLILGYVSTDTKAGFLGGILIAFILGYFINFMKSWKVPKWMAGLMPVLFIPVISTFVCGMGFLLVLVKPMAYLMTHFQNWIISLNGSSRGLLGAVIGACMGFDLGGPVNKTASLAANALGAQGVFGPLSAKIVGGMTPPIGAFIAVMLAKKKFARSQIEMAKTAFPMGLCFITEGTLPFAAADPVRFIISSVLGSSTAGAIVLAMGVECPATAGGIFVIPLMTHPLWFIVALIVGSLITGVVYAIIKKPDADEKVDEKENNKDAEESVDFDIEQL